MTQFLVHYGLHFVLPLLIAMWFYKRLLWKAYLLMIMGMLIDMDHFLANPIFDPNRCSINFHPLHSYWAIGLYVLLCVPKKTRIVGIGLVIHIIADSADCLLMNF